jgi:hypothetical protein
MSETGTGKTNTAVLALEMMVRKKQRSSPDAWKKYRELTGQTGKEVPEVYYTDQKNVIFTTASEDETDDTDMDEDAERTAAATNVTKVKIHAELAEQAGIPTFAPTLIICPVAIIPDWVNAVKTMFVGYTTYVYYGSSLNNLSIKGSRHLGPASLKPLLQSLTQTGLKYKSSTARTIIITSPGTFYGRLFHKEYIPIVFTDTDDMEIGDEDDNPADEDMLLVEKGVAVKASRATEWRKKKRVYEHDIATRNFHETAKHTATHVLIRYRWVLGDLSDYHIDTIIIDESHTIRNPFSATSHALQKMNVGRFQHLTATSLYSTAKDVMVILSLAWNLYNLNWDNWKAAGDLEGLFHPDYNPEQDVNTLEANGRTYTTKGLFTYMGPGDVLDAFTAAYREGFRMWMLCPDLVSEIGRATKWSTRTGLLVIRPIYEMISLRFSTTTRIIKEDGTAYYAGMKIPPASISTHEVAYGPDLHDEVSEFCRQMARSLRIMSKQALVGDAGAAPEGAAPTQQKEEQARMNFGNHRKAIMVALDYRNIRLFQSTSLSGLPNTDAEIRKATVQLRTGRPMTAKETDKAAGALDEGGPDLAGAERAAVYAKEDILGGLMTHHSQTKDSDRDILPGTRGEIIRWCMQTSPAFAWLIEFLHQHVRVKGKRVIVFVDLPYIQQ